MAKLDMRRLTLSMPWNLFLLTTGGVIAAIGLKCIAVPHAFISGSLFGTGMLIFYVSDWLSPAIWYAFINIPVFVVGWRLVGRRFFLYTAYGMAVNTLAVQFIPWVIPIQNTMLAAVAAGALYGVGLGIMLRSLGCDGGLTIIAIVLNQRYDIKIGAFNMAYNVILFLAAMFYMDIDHVLYSIILVFVFSIIVDYSMSISNQRKLVFIVSEQFQGIAHDIMHILARGCTFIPAIGAYTNQERKIVMTVVNNYQLKRLEELVYKRDPKAFLIIENTYNVLGQGFSRRREY